MEAEEIYMNQEAKMQAAASKDKQRGIPANKNGEASGGEGGGQEGKVEMGG